MLASACSAVMQALSHQQTHRCPQARARQSSRRATLTVMNTASTHAPAAAPTHAPAPAQPAAPRRVATVHRKTKETEVKVTVDIDGTGKCVAETPVGFLNHMLDQISSHGLFDLTVEATGDTWIDDHHTVEDIALALGTAFSQVHAQPVHAITLHSLAPSPQMQRQPTHSRPGLQCSARTGQQAQDSARARSAVKLI